MAHRTKGVEVGVLVLILEDADSLLAQPYTTRSVIAVITCEIRVLLTV